MGDNDKVCFPMWGKLGDIIRAQDRVGSSRALLLFVKG